MKTKKNRVFLIGIDEVGRGPLAGPVMVGAVYVPSDFDWGALPGVTDSKKLTPEKREKIYQSARELKRQGQIDYAVARVSAHAIDKNGIVPAIRKALHGTLSTLKQRHDYDLAQVGVRLDGGLVAPREYLHQETIIKGDEKEKVIGLASIIAKVTRDTYMERLSQHEEFSIYGFAEHKGYGTRRHRQVIQKYGLSKEHRVSFCRSFQNPG